MTDAVIQTNFSTGEWAPSYNARVDLKEYNSGAQLLRNFFVDYRGGGASTRPGTKYCLQCWNYLNTVRLIPFQAALAVGYALEFGNGYIRPYKNGFPILEGGLAITGITKANPAVVSVVNTLNVGDIVFIHSISGMTQLNLRFFYVTARTAGTISLANLFGVNLDSTTYSNYVSGGFVQKVFVISSPYLSTALPLLKFVQRYNKLILTHPDYPITQLVYTNQLSWAIGPATIGSTVSAPGGVGVNTTLGAGAVNYAYVVTAVDQYGEESGPSSFAALNGRTDLRTVAGTNEVVWSAVAGAVSYNIYKAEPSYIGAIPSGAQFGFVGNASGVKFNDSNIPPDFAQTPPVPTNPFSGSGVQSVTVTNGGSYATTPDVTFAASPGVTATGIAQMQASNVSVATAGTRYAVNDTITLAGGIVIRVDSLTGLGSINAITMLNPGAVVGSIPGNPLPQVSTSAPFGSGATFNVTWTVAAVVLTNPGTGYGGAPAVTFSFGTATATSSLGSNSLGNPSVPAIHQQRLVLGGQVLDPQSLNFSKPGSLFNFDRSFPTQVDDAFQTSIDANQLNEIKSMISMPGGLIVFSNSGSWLVNGGTAGAAITPLDIVANPQAYAGANDLPPIVANYDIIYAQAAGSVIRDMEFNFDRAVYASVDISVLSNHLFYGYTITEWAFAAEPFKTVWAVRNDGILLTLGYSPEHKLKAWAHHDMTDALVKSVCSVVETTPYGVMNAVYVVVQRTVSGVLTQYVERIADRFFSNGRASAWCVDSALQYIGAPASSFVGYEHLAGLSVIGLADGEVFGPFTMPASGMFQTAVNVTTLIVGRAFTPQFTPLQLDVSDKGGTNQGKLKKIPAVTVRVADTLGLKIGKSFSTLVDMKDLVVGQLNVPGNFIVSDLVTGDAKTIVDPSWDVPGQYCIQQSLPYPATILGLIPDIVEGDK